MTERTAKDAALLSASNETMTFSGLCGELPTGRLLIGVGGTGRWNTIASSLIKMSRSIANVGPRFRGCATQTERWSFRSERRASVPPPRRRDRIWGRGLAGREEHGVDHVDQAVGGVDVGFDDLRLVDVGVTAADAEVNAGALEGLG